MPIISSLTGKLEKREAENQPHADTAGIDPAMSKREALLTLIQEDLGEFPFEALWPQREEGSLLKILAFVNAGMILIIMIRVFVMK